MIPASPAAAEWLAATLAAAPELSPAQQATVRAAFGPHVNSRTAPAAEAGAAVTHLSTQEGITYATPR